MGGKAAGKRTPSLLPNYVVLILLAIFTLYPILLVFFNAVKTPEETITNPMGLPHEWRLENFVEAWRETGIARAIPNSLLVAFVSATCVTIIAALAGYSLARLNPRGGSWVTLYFLAGGSLPAQMFLVPLFFLWRRLSLVDNLWGLIIIYMGTQSPFSCYLMRSLFVSLPSDFEDAAKVDGASPLQAFWHIMLPLARPGFLTVFLMAWMGAWNEFFFANLFLHKQAVQTAALRYVVFSGEYYTNWAMTNAMGVLLVVPVLIIFLFTQETLIKGMTQGGLKM
jgi:raffinose/stachyose/melibiose transport system permease protein